MQKIIKSSFPMHFNVRMVVATSFFQRILNDLFVFLSDITYYILGLHMIKQRTKNWFWNMVVAGLWLTMALNWCT
jgi:hypothetical protein